MGRRRRNHSDDDDDALEREWLKKRQKSTAKEDGNRDDDGRSKDETSNQTDKGADIITVKQQHRQHQPHRKMTQTAMQIRLSGYA